MEQLGSFATTPKLVDVEGAKPTRRLAPLGVAEVTAQFLKTSTGHEQLTESNPSETLTRKVFEPTWLFIS